MKVSAVNMQTLEHGLLDRALVGMDAATDGARKQLISMFGTGNPSETPGSVVNVRACWRARLGLSPFGAPDETAEVKAVRDLMSSGELDGYLLHNTNLLTVR